MFNIIVKSTGSPFWLYSDETQTISRASYNVAVFFIIIILVWGCLFAWAGMISLCFLQMRPNPWRDKYYILDEETYYGQ